MRVILFFLLLVCLAAVQSSITPFFRVFSGQPNLIFLVVVAWSLDADAREAFAWAFVGGLLQDLLSIVPLGTSILPLCFTILMVKLMQQQLEGLSLLVYLMVVGIGSFVMYVLLFVGLGLVGYGIDLIPTVRYFLLPSLGYQLLLALPVYVLVRWLHQRSASRRGYGVSP